jgi:hypothetical protein
MTAGEIISAIEKTQDKNDLTVIANRLDHAIEKNECGFDALDFFRIGEAVGGQLVKFNRREVVSG